MDQSTSALLVASLTSIFTLLGVYIANRHNSKENQKRLEFEMEDRKTQRWLEVRKEILLNAVSDVGALNTLLIAVIYDPEKRSNPDTFQQYFSNLNKLSAVCSSKLYIHASKVSQEYGLAIMGLKNFYAKLYDLEAELKLYTEMSNSNGLELTQHNLKLCKASLNPLTTDEEYEKIKLEHNVCRELNKKYIDEFDRINEELRKKQYEVIQFVIERLKLAQPEVNIMINLIRAEVGLEEIELEKLFEVEKITPEDILEIARPD